MRAQLRANLARRKQQARARREGEGDVGKDGIAAVDAHVERDDALEDDTRG